MIKPYAVRMKMAKINHDRRTREKIPSGVKDIIAGKFTGDGPDMKRVNIKGAQKRAKKAPITLPKII